MRKCIAAKDKMYTGKRFCKQRISLKGVLQHKKVGTTWRWALIVEV